jgi:hypothetical protein
MTRNMYIAPMLIGTQFWRVIICTLVPEKQVNFWRVSICKSRRCSWVLNSLALLLVYKSTNADEDLERVERALIEP